MLPRLCLLLGIVCIGFSAIFVRLAAVSGLVSAFYRVAIAAVAFVPFWLFRKPSLPDLRMLLLSALAGALFAFDLAFWNVSLFLTRAATSTVLAYLAPVWVGAVALLIFKEKFKRYYWPGALLALCGMLVIMGLKKVADLQFGLGNILSIVSSFFYAGYLLTAQAVRKRTGTFTFTGLSLIASTLTLLFICWVRGERLADVPAGSWPALLGLGLISHLGGWLSINYALGHVKASVASVTLLGQPVVTALLAIPILGEGLGAAQVAGGLLILAGIYLVNRN